MGKHAGNIAGWAQDIGADRKRKANRMPRFGKHAAAQHVGATEGRAMARFMRIQRALVRLPAAGRHGVSYARISNFVRVPVIGVVSYA